MHNLTKAITDMKNGIPPGIKSMPKEMENLWQTKEHKYC